MPYKNKKDKKFNAARYYAENKEHISDKNKAYYAANRDRLNNYDKERQKDPHRKAQKLASGRRRSAAKKQGCPDLSPQELYAIKLLYLSRAYLGPEYHVDHIVPLSRGGKHELSNLQIVPAEYNLSKGNSIRKCTKVTLQDHCINSVPAF